MSNNGKLSQIMLKKHRRMLHPSKEKDLMMSEPSRQLKGSPNILMELRSLNKKEVFMFQRIDLFPSMNSKALSKGR